MVVTVSMAGSAHADLEVSACFCVGLPRATGMLRAAVAR